MTVLTALVDPARTAPSSTAPADRMRRWQVAAARGSAVLSTTRGPMTSERGRRRLQVCSAARLLTALGVRVEVSVPPAGWPRCADRGLLVLADGGSWVGDLALLTAVPGVLVTDAGAGRRPLVGGTARRCGVVVDGEQAAVDRVAALLAAGRTVTVCPAAPGSGLHAAALRAAAATGSPVCPVTVRHRLDGVPVPAGDLPPERAWRQLPGAGELVVEVGLLPARAGAGGPAG